MHVGFSGLNALVLKSNVVHSLHVGALQFIATKNFAIVLLVSSKTH